MKIKITKNEILKLDKVLKDSISLESNKLFGYLVLINKKKIKEDVEAILNIIKPSDGYIKYELTRKSLCEKYCKRNENGDPVVNGKSYVFPEENKEKWVKELNEFLEQNKECLIKHNKHEKENAEFLKTESEIEITPISFSHVPENINTELLEGLIPLFGESEEEILKLLKN